MDGTCCRHGDEGSMFTFVDKTEERDQLRDLGTDWSSSIILKSIALLKE
jgi:hypothetical protein